MTGARAGLAERRKGPRKLPYTGFSRDHHVALWRQLAVGFEAAIRDGHIRPGTALPSTRDLSRRARVHRSTVAAAYGRLRRRGWVRRRPGSRFEVRGEDAGPLLHASPQERLPPTGLRRDRVAAALAAAYGAGRSRAAALERIERTLEACRAGGQSPRPVLFEPRVGLRAILRRELERALSGEIEATGRLTHSMAGPVCMRWEILRAHAIRSGRSHLPCEVIPLRLAGGTRERGIVRRIVPAGLVALLSASRTVREYGRELAAREFARGVSFRAIDPEDRRAAVRAVPAARVVFHDESARGRIPPTRAPVHRIRLIRRDELAAIRRYLGLPERRRGT